MHINIRTKNKREQFRIFDITGGALHVFDVARVVHRRRNHGNYMCDAIVVKGRWLYWNGRLNETADGKNVHQHKW